jgi:hypothetical protein
VSSGGLISDEPWDSIIVVNLFTSRTTTSVSRRILPCVLDKCILFFKKIISFYRNMFGPMFWGSIADLGGTLK